MLTEAGVHEKESGYRADLLLYYLIDSPILEAKAQATLRSMAHCSQQIRGGHELPHNVMRGGVAKAIPEATAQKASKSFQITLTNLSECAWPGHFGMKALVRRTLESFLGFHKRRMKLTTAVNM